MIKRNNKGFTLLELIISIFILTIVISLGYRVINKYTIDVKNQSNINKGQLTINDMNEYLTKDLEKASNVVLSSNYLTQINNFTDNSINNENIKDVFLNYSGDKTFDYSYNISYKENNLGVIYEVNINQKDENNYIYTIKRTNKKDGISITFINNGIIKKDEILDKSSTNIEVQLPFEISLESPYKVNLGYNGKNNKFEKYEFTVSSRLSDITLSPEQETPPPVDDIKPPEEWEEPNKVIDYNVIGFWIADANKKQSDNLYTWVSTDGKILGDAYANQDKEKDQNKDKDKYDKFNIEGFARPENNGHTSSYIGYSTIDKDKNWEGQVKEAYIGQKNIVKISIYVSPNTKLENFSIQKLQGNANIQIPETLDEGWHHCTITTNSQVSFKFNGELYIDKNKVSSGYAYVVFERKDSSSNDTPDLNGDIVFDFYNKFYNNKIETFANKIQSNIVNSTEEKPVDVWLSNNTEDLKVFVYGHENKVAASVKGSEMNVVNQNFKNITGMIFSVSGDIRLKNFQIEFEPHDGKYKKETIEIELDKNTYTFDFLKYLEYENLKVTKLSCQLDVNNMKNSGDISKKAEVKVDFIYKK